MLIDRQFNTFTFDEYFHHIKNHKDYDDFNTLGLYRSIVENENIDMEQKKAVRDFAHMFFEKFFEFLQVKDPHTYLDISTLGHELTEVQNRVLRKNIRANAAKILKDKRIKHGNFGVFSVGECPEDCWCGGGKWMKKGNRNGDNTMLINFGMTRSHYRGALKSKQEVKETRSFRDKLREIPLDD